MTGNPVIEKNVPIPKPTQHRFQVGNTFGGGRRGKNKITKDVRACFAKVYEGMGSDIKDPETGKPLTGDDAMLVWAKDNPTQFYVLFSKMIETKVVIDEDSVESWLDKQVFNEHSNKLSDVKAVDVTDEKAAEVKQIVTAGDEVTRDSPDTA